MKNSLILISTICCSFLSACSSAPKEMAKVSVIEGRPTQTECVERQDRAFEIEGWMRDYPKDIEALNAVRDEIETVLFNDGCHWLYGASERLKGRHLSRVKAQEDLLRDYAGVLEEYHEQQEFLKLVLSGNIGIAVQEGVLEQLGGGVIKQNGAYIAQSGSKDLY